MSTLKSAPHFAVGGVGITGKTSEPEKALRTLLVHREAAAALESLLDDPRTTVEGRLYALLGLKMLERRTFAPSDKEKSTVDLREAAAFGKRVQAHFARYLSVTENASVMTGCLVSRRPVASVTREIHRGLFSLPPGSSVPDPAPVEREQGGREGQPEKRT